MASNRLTCINVVIPYILILIFIHLSHSYAMDYEKIRVGVPHYSPPLSFKEQDEVALKGFSVDLANIIAAKMDLEAETYAINDADLIKALNDGKIDVVISIMDDSYSTANTIQTSVQCSRGYFVNSQYSTFVPSEDLSRFTVAIEKGRKLSGLLPPKQTVINYIETETQQEALALVDSGKAQVYISRNSGSTRYIIDKKDFQNIYQLTLPIETVPLVIAINKSNMDLFTSMSIAYGKILEDGDYQRIYYKWLANDSRIILIKYRNHIFGAVLITISASLIFIIWNFILKKEITKIGKKFQTSEQKYRDLIESSPDMIHLISRGGDIKLTNKIALKKIGYNIEEITSQTLHNLVRSEQKKAMTDFIEDVFQDKYSNKEFTFISKNGNELNVEIVATILNVDDSSENLACFFSRDITERKRLEENLIYSDRLAVMGRMAAGIAHEINNPLWVILSNAEDALTNQLSYDELHECLESIERNGLRAAKSIEDLLTFARPAPMKVVAIDLVKVIEDSLVLIRQKLKKKNIRVETKYPSESIFFKGDENSIQQLIINIILNAIQALDKDGSIIISVSVTEKPGDRGIALEIRDNGKGIPDEVLQYIFNPFYTSGKTNGFGLGLFMSKIIVEKHHGSLSVRSQSGKGTVITICFPAKTEARPELQKPIFRELAHE